MPVGGVVLYARCQGEQVISWNYLPENVRVLEAESFAGTGIDRVWCPNGLTEIQAFAFSDCRSLTAIRIPKSVQAISDQAFQNSGSITIYGLAGSYAESFAQTHGYPFQSE